MKYRETVEPLASQEKRSELIPVRLRSNLATSVAMVVVENATVDYLRGRGPDRTIRANTDENLDGLKRLADKIKQEGARACLQINHAGRSAG